MEKLQIELRMVREEFIPPFGEDEGDHEERESPHYISRGRGSFYTKGGARRERRNLWGIRLEA